MASGSISKELVAVPAGQDALRKRPGWIGLPEKIVRGAALAAVVGGAALTAREVAEPGSLPNAAAKVWHTSQSLRERFNRVINPETADQKVAREMWEQSQQEGSSGGVVFDIVAWGDQDAKGRPIDVKLRNRPVTSANEEVRVIGKLLPGSHIDRALVVWGKDPQFPSDKNRQARWLVFPDPNSESGEMVFAHYRGFDPASVGKIIEAKPLDLVSVKVVGNLR